MEKELSFLEKKLGSQISSAVRQLFGIKDMSRRAWQGLSETWDGDAISFVIKRCFMGSHTEIIFKAGMGTKKDVLRSGDVDVMPVSAEFALEFFGGEEGSLVLFPFIATSTPGIARLYDVQPELISPYKVFREFWLIGKQSAEVVPILPAFVTEATFSGSFQYVHYKPISQEKAGKKLVVATLGAIPSETTCGNLHYKMSIHLINSEVPIRISSLSLA